MVYSDNDDISKLPPLEPLPTELSEISDALTKNYWYISKRSLVADHPWLRYAGFNLTVDAVVYQTLNPLQYQTPKYIIFQIESLLASASALLDRCLIYRREMYDLEAKGVQSALSYQLYRSQRGPLEDIELSAVYRPGPGGQPDSESSIRLEREAEKKGLEKASQAFATAATPLEQGFAASSAGNAQSAAFAEDAEELRVKNVSKKWVALDAYQKALESQHCAPGHALNYKDRFNRIRRFLEQDIATAYRKIQCIEKGASQIFDVNVQLDAPTELNYLDTLVEYVRKVIQQIEIATLEEVEFEHVVSIRQPVMTSPSSHHQYYNDQQFKTVINADGGPEDSGLLTLDLTRHGGWVEFSPSVLRVRLRGIGLSMISNDPRPDGVLSTSAIVIPPDTMGFDGKPFDTSPIIVERIGQYDGTTPRIVSFPAINNIDPRGKWQIQVSSNIVVGSNINDATGHARSVNNIQEIKLHLKVAALLLKGRSNWTKFV